MRYPMPTLTSLAEVAQVLEHHRDVYVRWSAGPESDCVQEGSVDALTGADLPGLSANPLDVASWWEGSAALWVARRLYDYSHLREEKREHVRPWVLTGEAVDRGPDNEPLIRCREPIAWIDPVVVREATAEIGRQEGPWGTLNRR